MGTKARELKPRPLDRLIHGEGVGEVTHFDFFHVWAGGPLGKHGVGNVAGNNPLVIIEDISGYVWLEPVAACKAAATAENLLCWCTVVGVP